MSNMLSPLMIGLLVLVVILLGTFAGRTVRRLVPRDHLTEETKSLVSVSMEVVATISALLLGLLISNANNSFIALGGQVTSLSAQIIRLDQILRRYGSDTELPVTSYENTRNISSKICFPEATRGPFPT